MTVNWVWTRWCPIIDESSRKKKRIALSLKGVASYLWLITLNPFLCHTHLPSVWHCSHPRKERLSWHFNWLTDSFVFTASEVRSAEICDCVCSAPPNAGRLKSMCVALVWKCLWSEVQLKTEKEEKGLQVTSLTSRWDFFGLNSTRAATEVEEDQTVLSDSFKSFICSLTRNKS